MTAADFKPHRGVHRPLTFICGANPDDAIVTFLERPAAVIASRLLEDVGDWHQAIQHLEKTDVPPAVTEALDALHDAMCGWADWTAAATKRTEAGS